jgi:hypothetical protein
MEVNAMDFNDAIDSLDAWVEQTSDSYWRVVTITRKGNESIRRFKSEDKALRAFDLSSTQFNKYRHLRVERIYVDKGTDTIVDSEMLDSFTRRD